MNDKISFEEIIMDSYFSRTSLLLGEEALDKLSKKKIIIFGLGGVGGYCVEALVRSGIKSFTLVDNDVVSSSNLNRQIIATRKTIGRKKVEAMKERILEINDEVEVKVLDKFALKDNIDEFNLESYDYVIDAIDTISAKIAICEKCDQNNIPLISSMGAGNKLNPLMFEVSDIYSTSVCPLAKVMRRELKKRGVKKLKVVYSKEEALTPKTIIKNEENGKITPGSVSFIPSVVGLIIASEVIKDLIK